MGASGAGLHDAGKHTPNAGYIYTYRDVYPNVKMCSYAVGLAITFFCGSTDKPRAGELVNVLREAKQVRGSLQGLKGCCFYG